MFFILPKKTMYFAYLYEITLFLVFLRGGLSAILYGRLLFPKINFILLHIYYVIVASKEV